MTTSTPNAPAQSSQLGLSLSALSINSEEDWNRSSSDVHAPPPPGTPPADAPPADGRRASVPGQRKLADLLRKHAEDGKDVRLSAEDELKLEQELAQWINSDSSPYEDDDDCFERVKTARNGAEPNGAGTATPTRKDKDGST